MKSQINILYQSRANLFSKPGGDTVQIMAWRAGLLDMGFRVDVSVALEPHLADYDLVHVFNITRVHETYLQVRHAGSRGKPVACSPIYHNLSEYNRMGRYGRGKYLFRLLPSDSLFEYARGVVNCLRDPSQFRPVARQALVGYRNQQAAVLASSDWIVFGSALERAAVLADFGNPGLMEKQTVVRLGVKAPSQPPDSAAFVERFGLKDFVLCVGRIEDLKNQLNLLRAMKGSDLPLVLIGPVNPMHAGYARRVLEEVEANPRARYLGPLDKTTLWSAYKAARVHVLPSWVEATGLVSLEAALAGCNIVSTDRGYAREYLGDRAWYCDPSDQDSIRAGIEEAYNASADHGLQNRVRKNLDQDLTIEMLAGIYRRIVGDSGCGN